MDLQRDRKETMVVILGTGKESNLRGNKLGGCGVSQL